MTLLFHPRKESTEDTVSSQTNLAQELSRWWLAPPSGRTGEQRLLPGEKQVKVGPLHTVLPLSLFLPAIVSYFWNLGTSLHSNLILKGTFQQALQVSTVKVARILQNLCSQMSSLRATGLALGIMASHTGNQWMHRFAKAMEAMGEGAVLREMFKRRCLAGKMPFTFPPLFHAQAFLVLFSQTSI